MTDLNELMTLPGAQAAFEMNDRGELQQHVLSDVTQLNETALDLLAHMCVANSAIATMQARGWEANSDNKGFYPINGFTLIGMDWSAISAYNVGVVVSNDQVDYETTYKMLAAQGAAE